MHLNIIVSLILTIAVIYSPPALAQNDAVAKKKAVEGQLKDIKAKKQSLEKDAKAAQKEYQSTKKTLVKTSAKVQKNQSELYTLEKSLDDLREDQKRIKAELELERDSLAEIITALQRIERTPPQAMMARPAAPINTARGAMLLQRILPVLHLKAQDLKTKSEQYAENEKELKTKQSKLVTISKDLSQEEKMLKKLVDDRKLQYANLNSDLALRKKEVEQVSKKAKDLSDLVKRLENERTRNATKKASAPTKQAALPKIGDSRLPLSGNVRTKFNQKDDFGAKSKGVTIEGRGGALIVAPMGGIIRFAGYFKNYGNMVIIEHQNGYHSLIAGLEKIDTVVDQNILAGEPLGKLYRSKNAKSPSLYFELRHKGKAIDPARKFTELG